MSAAVAVLVVLFALLLVVEFAGWMAARENRRRAEALHNRRRIGL